MAGLKGDSTLLFKGEAENIILLLGNWFITIVFYIRIVFWVVTTCGFWSGNADDDSV
jgi:hypothetical protein